eukprot:TCALIF_03642-PA protein Name:"Similar to Vav Protein vav (Drosophila melanogaster)" AED:0.02 eAED:0.02 QI:0/0/0/0.66/0.5/0.33/3/0/716
MEELWRECAQWLEKFNVISKQDPVLSPKAQLSDLIAVLRDGVVLCQLVHSLDPNSIDMTRVLYDSPEPATGRAVNDFLCRHNIFLFLHAIIANFHLNMDEHFFQPEDLYHCKNVGKVIETLSVLSYCAQFKRSGVPGFPKKEKLLPKRLKQERKVYETLNQLYGEAETEYLYDSFNRSAKDLEQSHYEDIYQTIFPPKQPRLSLDISFGKKSKRAAPVEELIDTEDKYLENLIMVRDVFRDPLTLMSPYHKSIVFYQLDDLIQLHSDILFGLKQKRTDIGLVFLEHIPHMSKLYGQYCVNLPVAMEVVERLQMSNTPLRKQISESQIRAKPSSFPLSSHLVIPFQRFLKYHLLLKEISRNTPPDFPDYLNISKACEEMLKIGMDVNEKKREHEDCEKQIQTDEADLKLIANVSNTIKLMQLPFDSKLCDFGRLRKAGDVFSVRLFRRADARKTPLTIIVKTSLERDAWFHAILTAMDCVNPVDNTSQGHVLQMKTFELPTECFQCGKAFQGKFFQGYHCLRCQVDLHKSCIGDCCCIEIGSIKKADSVTLPTLMADSLERSNSTLSLAIPDQKRNSNSKMSHQIKESQRSFEQEMEATPLEQQPWFAGTLSGNVASERLEHLPVGTFLVRQRANGMFALMLKTPETPKGVKAMAVNQESLHTTNGTAFGQTFFFSDARKFDSIQKLVSYYRSHDLTENFDYSSLKGVFLKNPYKSV